MRTGLHDHQLQHLARLTREGRLTAPAVRDLAAQLHALVRRLEHREAGSATAREAWLVAGVLERGADDPALCRLAVPSALHAYRMLRDALREAQRRDRTRHGHGWRTRRHGRAANPGRGERRVA